MKASTSLLLGSVLAIGLLGIVPRHETMAYPPTEKAQSVVVHLSHFTDDLHAGFMALKVGNALQKRGAKVTLFIDLEGARLAHRHNDLAVRWGESETTLAQLFGQFVSGGGKVIVCPHCAHHVGVSQETVREGVSIGTEDQIAEVMLAAAKVIDY